jgi:hypothetical protein
MTMHALHNLIQDLPLVGDSDAGTRAKLPEFSCLPLCHLQLFDNCYYVLSSSRSFLNRGMPADTLVTLGKRRPRRQSVRYLTDCAGWEA